jgi:cupin fold WbuC family metalloprotein
MREIYSKVKPSMLLHVINRVDEITTDRVDLVDGKQFIQVSCFEMDKGKTFKPHRHIPNEKVTKMTQESWVVIKGRVKVYLFDINDSVLETPILESGDCSITLRGGHTYESLEEGTIVYEYKTGPYFGQEKDKVFIEERKNAPDGSKYPWNKPKEDTTITGKIKKWLS